MAFIFEQNREKKLDEYLRFLISKLDCYFEHLLKSLGEIDKDTLLNIRNCLNEFENIKAEVRTNNDNTAIHIQSLLNLTEEHVQAMVNTVERKMTELLPETVFPMVEAEVSVLAPDIIKEEVDKLTPDIKKEVDKNLSAMVTESVQNLRNDETFIEQIKGKDGKDGIDGKDGKNGYTPQKGVDYFDGKDGYTPQKNVDYFDGKDYVLTEADKSEITTMVVEMLGGYPVYSVIDENNIVTIKGLSKNEAYYFKLEMEDGSTVDVGEFEPIEPIENQLPISTDTSGNLYVGDNGEKGYKTNYKISVSSGSESSTSDACVSGFIKLKEGVQSEINIENITVSSASSINNFVFYNADKEKMNGYAGPAGSFNYDVKVTDGVYRILTQNWFTKDNLPTYFRFSCGEITDETIVTVSEWTA